MNPAHRRRFFELWGEVADLTSAIDVLQWDQETMMPPRGVTGRGKVLAALAGLRHARLTAPELLELSEELAASSAADGEDFAQAREARRQIQRAVKVPASLAREVAEAESTGLAAWREARKRSDFFCFQPQLARMVELKRQEAAALSEGGPIYDALLDEFEPGATEAELVPLFRDLCRELVPLVQEVSGRRRKVDESPVRGSFPAAAQLELGRRMAAAFGYDFEAGRLDLSTHPFCTGFSRGDVRITWRYEEDDLRPALFGILHETGHALYEQGLPAEWERTPLGAGASLGIHESQSRLWENLVARSRGFWNWALPQLQELLPGTGAVSVDTLWPALHTVRPSLIRVEADEATYNLHVAIRFDLERAILAGELEVPDLPAAWDDAYERLLGIRAERVTDGVLQDIHWAQGAFGYFPTYTLGTLAACQLFDAAAARLGDLEDHFRRGDFASLLGWLRKEIHAHGRRYRTQDLIRRATGRPLSAASFLTSIRATIAEIYPD